MPVYVALEPVTATVVEPTGYIEWDPAWDFETVVATEEGGGTSAWPPGWKVTPTGDNVGSYLSMSADASRIIGQTADVTCEILDGNDASSSKFASFYILLKASLTSTGATVQLKKAAADSYADYLLYKVTNYTGSKYGFSASGIYLNLTDQAGDSVTWTAYVPGVYPDIVPDADPTTAITAQLAWTASPSATVTRLVTFSLSLEAQDYNGAKIDTLEPLVELSLSGGGTGDALSSSWAQLTAGAWTTSIMTLSGAVSDQAAVTITAALTGYESATCAAFAAKSPSLDINTEPSSATRDVNFSLALRVLDASLSPITSLDPHVTFTLGAVGALDVLNTTSADLSSGVWSSAAMKITGAVTNQASATITAAATGYKSHTTTAFALTSVWSLEAFGATRLATVVAFYDANVCCMDATHAICAYTDGSDSHKAKGRLLTFDSDEITAVGGAVLVYNASSAWPMNIAKYDATHAVVLICSGADCAAQSLLLTGTTLSLESSLAVSSTATVNNKGLCRMSDTAALAAYVHNNSGNYTGYVLCVTRSDTTLSAGAPATFRGESASQVSYLSLASFSSGKAIIAFQDAANSQYGTAKCVSLSGETVTVGDAAIFSAATTTHIAAACLDADTAIVFYTAGGKTYAKACTLTGTTLTFGDAVEVLSASLLYPRAVGMDDMNAIVAGESGVSGECGKALAVSVSGTSIVVGTRISVSVGNMDSSGMAAIAADRAILVYSDDGDSTYPQARIVAKDS